MLGAGAILGGCGSHGFTPPQSAARPDGYTPAAPPLTLAGRSIHISTRGLRLIESFEGFGSCPYFDAYGRVWTRGYGETEGIHRSSPCISRSTGEVRLRGLVEARYQWAVRGLGVSFNQNQIDALDSFVWNLGAGIFTGSLRRSIQAHNPYPLLAYDHAGGVVLSGLARRRREEVALFLLRSPAPAPPTQQQLKRRLWADYRKRDALRVLLTRHSCRPPLHARPGRYHTVCGRWLREGAEVNRAINALHKKGIR